MSELDVTEQRERRQIHGGDAILKATATIDLSDLLTVQEVAGRVPAGKRFVPIDVITDNATAPITNVDPSDVLLGFQPSDTALIQLDLGSLARRNDVKKQMNGTDEYLSGIAGDTLGVIYNGPSPETLPLKGFSIAEGVGLNTIPAFSLAIGKITLAGMPDAGDNGDLLRDPTWTGGKRAYAAAGVAAIRWDDDVSGPGWYIYSETLAAYTLFSPDDVEFPDLAVFDWITPAADPLPTLTRGIDTPADIPELVHQNVANGRRSYSDTSGQYTFEFDGSVWNLTDPSAQIVMASIDNAGSDPFLATYLLDGPGEPVEGAIASLAGDWHSNGLAGGKQRFANGLHTADWDGSKWIVTLDYDGQSIIVFESESGDDTPTPVGSDFVDLLQTSNDAFEPVALDVGPKIDITVLYLLLDA